MGARRSSVQNEISAERHPFPMFEMAIVTHEHDTVSSPDADDGHKAN
jgi:hypothetical protein